MKNQFLFMAAAFLLAVATSCTKPNDGTDFSNLTVEENKANIETTGLDMLDEMKVMEDEPAMQANISMVNYMSLSDPFAGNPNTQKKVDLTKTIAFSPVFALATYRNNDMKSVLKSLQVNPAEDPETIQEAYDLLVGVYTWNSELEVWDYTQTGDVIVFLFPSTEGGTVNNASYTVSYTGYTGPNPIEGYDGDLPQDVSAVLKVDDTEVLSFVVNIDYNTEGYPTKIESTLTMGQWVWYAMASNTDNKAFATEFSFKHSTNVLLRFTLDAAGNWTQENIDANTTYYVEVYNPETYEWYWQEVSKEEYYDRTEVDVHKVVNSGNASFQLMNLKMVGSIDVLNLVTKMEEIEDTYDWGTQEEEAVAAGVEVVNQYVSLSLRYADSDDIIALVEAYPVSEEYTYESWEYNPNTGNYDVVTITETDYWIDFRLVFADGSKSDLETYFDEGFEDLIDELEQYLDELETTYGK
ncbi:MAG: hypothetical protein M0P66_08385 [Salinivirgaceae bacterium]|nr:hypothetical protein [Salinivirgaceae bacterium]